MKPMIIQCKTLVLRRATPAQMPDTPVSMRMTAPIQMTDSPRFNENVCILLTEQTFTDQLLGDRNGHLATHTQVGQVVQEPAKNTHHCATVSWSDFSVDSCI